jgi:predicted metal-dependent HD superfamily phosphohydrolase
MSQLIKETEDYILQLLNYKLNISYVYHNLAHTQRVVNKVNEISSDLNLDEESQENLQLAAWFHDTGFITAPDNHEEESVKYLKNFLEDKKIEKERIEVISNLVLSTKLGHTPKNDLEKVIIDADCSHIGDKTFDDKSILLRKEWEANKGDNFTDIEWCNINIEFLTNGHKFHTIYALKNWSKTKAKNLAKLIKYKYSLEQDSIKFNQKQEAISIKKNKGDVPERGVETMFRVALRNHITLSDIADTKANILLSVNAIIISMSFSTLIPKLDNESNSYLIIPSIIFIFFTVICMILSILATRPNVTQGKFTKEDVVNKKVNLLFFGNFHKMKLDDFEWGIKEMMQDRDYLYGSLTKDLYFLGLVLNRKYNLLRLTYTVFMIGIIMSVIAFSLAFAIQEGAL